MTTADIGSDCYCNNWTSRTTCNTNTGYLLMSLTQRVRRLERDMAPPDPAALALTAEDHARIEHMFESAEKRNGPPPCNPDGTLTSDMDLLAAWVDGYPS